MRWNLLRMLYKMPILPNFYNQSNLIHLSIQVLDLDFQKTQEAK
jgi:hypothetical protein